MPRYTVDIIEEVVVERYVRVEIDAPNLATARAFAEDPTLETQYDIIDWYDEEIIETTDVRAVDEPNVERVGITLPKLILKKEKI